MTPRTLITTYTELGRWSQGERYCNQIEVYSADFYGNGQRVYLESWPIFQLRQAGHVNSRHMPGGSSDGHPERIARRLAESGVTL